MNRLTTERVTALTVLFQGLTGPESSKRCSRESQRTPLVITGNKEFFSVGAGLDEIAALGAVAAFEFAKMGQQLMRLIDVFPVPVVAAVSGYCMGGGLDLALACDLRICAANSVLGHRGAALGLMTGWGGTQRLSRLVGRGRALQMFVAAEKLGAAEAMEMGLVSEIVADPLARGIAIARAVPELM